MDVAKYIGAFLLKNQFCYIHGLGNLELRRKPASYDGEALQGPQYNVVLTRGGSIDDNLAAFIANGEQTSISKAANALRDFATEARADLHAGKTVAVPGVGHFTMQGGTIDFITDSGLNYAPPSVPVLKNAKRLEEEPVFKTVSNTPTSAATEEHAKGPSIAWGKILLIILILAAIAAAVVFGIRYLNSPNSASEPAPAREEASSQAAQEPVATTQPTDTMGMSAPAVSPAANDQGGNYRVVLNTYGSRAQADRRVRFLSTTALGNVAQVVPLDSTRFQVVVPYSAALQDSTRVLDSLSRVYGGKATLSR